MDRDDFIFGIRTVIEAIRSGKNPEKTYIRKGLDNELFRELFHLLRERNIPFQFVPVEKLNSITRKNHQGVIALIPHIDYQPIEELLPMLFDEGAVPLLLILDGITDVRNLGAIARSAECAGVHAMIIPAKGSAGISSDAIKTSAGALHHLPVCRTADLPATLRYLKNSGIKIVAATEKADRLYTTANMKNPVAVITGSEERGISPTLLKMADETVKIPVLGKIASLNVSVASALLIYEAVRQRADSQV